MTKKLFLVSLMFLIIFSGCSSKYNTNPDNSNKIHPGSPVDASVPIQSIDQLVRGSDLMIVGTVTGKRSKEFLSEQPHIAKMIENKVPDTKTENFEAVMVDQVKIDEVIYGSCYEKFVHVRQYYKAKFEKGQKVVFILRKDILLSDNRYVVSEDENCLFKVNKSEKLMSLTPNMTVAKYDERPLSLLKEDLKKSIKKVKNK